MDKRVGRGGYTIFFVKDKIWSYQLDYIVDGYTIQGHIFQGINVLEKHCPQVRFGKLHAPILLIETARWQQMARWQ